jgi:hypothetical protein
VWKGKGERVGHRYSAIVQALRTNVYWIVLSLYDN